MKIFNLFNNPQLEIKSIQQYHQILNNHFNERIMLQFHKLIFKNQKSPKKLIHNQGLTQKEMK